MKNGNVVLSHRQERIRNFAFEGGLDSVLAQEGGLATTKDTFISPREGIQYSINLTMIGAKKRMRR